MNPQDIVKQNTSQAFDAFWLSRWAKDNYMGPSRLAYMQWLADAIREMSDGPVLDVGCGDGTLLDLLGEGVGVDYSRVAVHLTRRRGFEAHLSDATSLPFGDGAFPCVVCVETLEHVDDPAAVARELMRVSGDLIVLSVPDGEIDTWDGHKHFFKKDDFAALFSGCRVGVVRKKDLLVIVEKP
jgi:2-polyprenyl-3-methyl-5-hydroxy-6-metoxy-1,4-benzoquinol methylase